MSDEGQQEEGFFQQAGEWVDQNVPHSFGELGQDIDTTVSAVENTAQAGYDWASNEVSAGENFVESEATAAYDYADTQVHDAVHAVGQEVSDLGQEMQDY